MTTANLKEIIRALIREELNSALPTMIPQTLTEILSNKTKSPAQVSTGISTPSSVRPAIKSVAQAPKPVEKRKYCENPLLNDILNETVIKIPTDGGTGVSLDALGFSRPGSIPVNASPETPTMMPEMIMESATIPPTIAVVPEQVPVVAAINKNYRNLMKAIDKKKSSGMMSSNVVSMDSSS